MIMFLAAIIFVFCVWAVFSKHFCDGIVTKHFLAFSAIVDSIALRDPENIGALMTASGLLMGGVFYWFYKHKEQIRAKIRVLYH